MFGRNNNWFAFQDDFARSTEESAPTFLVTSSPPRNDLGPAANIISPPNSSGDSSSDDEVVLGEDEDLADTASSAKSNKIPEPNLFDVLERESKSSLTYHSLDYSELTTKLEKIDISDDLSLFQHRSEESSAGTEIPSGGPVIDDKIPFDVHFPEHFEVAGQTPDSPNVEKKADQSHSESADASVVPEGHMVNPITGEEVAGVEPDGTIKAMEKMLKEGVVGEATPLFKGEHHGSEPKKEDSSSGNSDFSDVNYWRSDYTPSDVEEKL